MDRGGRARLHRRPPPRTTSRRRAPRVRTRSAGATRSSCRPTARPGSSPRRAGRRADADPLRAARVAGAQPALRAAEQPRARVASTPGRTRSTRRGRGLPLRVHHLPADRAPHRRRDEPHPALPLRAPAGDVLRGLADGWPPSAGSSTAAGRRSSPRARRSRRGCWSPSGCARCGWATGSSSRSGCPTTGAATGSPRGDSRQRPGQRRRWTPTSTSRTRSAPATSGPAGARAGPSSRPYVEDYRARAGARGHGRPEDGGATR